MKKAIVVDLDGTLLNTNTFIHYIKYVCKEALKRGDVFRVGWICLLVLLRKLRLISSHEELKKWILTVTGKYTNAERMERFAESLYKYENKKVVSLMSKYKDAGYVNVLSSAAPCVYAYVVGRQFGFEYICSTEMPFTDVWHENVREEKKKRTLELLYNNSLILAVLITDHYDDLPLLLMEKEDNYVVNPTEKSKKVIVENHVMCKYVYGK